MGAMGGMWARCGGIYVVMYIVLAEHQKPLHVCMYHTFFSKKTDRKKMVVSSPPTV